MSDVLPAVELLLRDGWPIPAQKGGSVEMTSTSYLQMRNMIGKSFRGWLIR